MKILVTGATGFVGKALCEKLAAQNHELVVVTRNREKAKAILPMPHVPLLWDFKSELSHSKGLDNLDAVIHLAGENLFAKRWNPPFKERLYQSRIESTRKLVNALQSIVGGKPRVFINASAVGFYGDVQENPAQKIDETHPPGTDFLARLCVDWENSLFNSLPEVRKIALRFGIVLGKGGGALEKMLPAFKFGLGASLGNGKQWMSWIHIEDLISIILEGLNQTEFYGPINACSPHPVTQKEFADTLAYLLGTVRVMRIPKFILRPLVGEASQVLLSNQRVIPHRLQEAGFQFQYPRLEDALKSVLPKEDQEPK